MNDQPVDHSIFNRRDFFPTLPESLEQFSSADVGGENELKIHGSFYDDQPRPK
jgi:hypothetical protein